jgi:flagellar biosynthesis protein FliR
MNIDSLLPWALSVALLSVRLTVALALSPALAAYGIPTIVRVVLMVVLAALVFAQRAPPEAATHWTSNPALIVGPVVCEILIGALLGLGVHAVLGALALAGRLLDVQIGFAIGSVFDPVSGSSANVLGSIAALLGVTVFVTSNGHLGLAQLVGGSIDALPLGELPEFADPLRPVLAAGSIFTLGVALAAPVAVSLLLTDLALGVMSRNMPQINVLLLAMPVKVVVGYLVLAYSMMGWGQLLQQGFRGFALSLGVR